jgi:hypothetical protein
MAHKRNIVNLSRDDEERLRKVWQIRDLVRDFKEGERLLTQLVKEARECGSTWQEIADVMGLTQQAVSARYGPKASAAATKPPPRQRSVAVAKGQQKLLA